jgi:hypothetical protein
LAMNSGRPLAILSWAVVLTVRCDDRVTAFEAAVASTGAGTCSADADCKCFPGGVSKKHSCGGITDAKTSEKVMSITADYLKAGCNSGIDCAATVCMPACREGKCTSAQPEVGVTCDARTAEIDKVLASATRKCTADKDCACFRGGVSKSEPCGGIVDAKTNARFEALAKEWSGAGCKNEGVMCPAVVCATTCNKGTCGPPAAGKIIQ